MVYLMNQCQPKDKYLLAFMIYRKDDTLSHVISNTSCVYVNKYSRPHGICPSSTKHLNYKWRSRRCEPDRNTNRRSKRRLCKCYRSCKTSCEQDARDCTSSCKQDRRSSAASCKYYRGSSKRDKSIHE